MSDRARKHAFVAVCLLVAGAVVTLLALSGDREPARRASTVVKSVEPPTPPAPPARRARGLRVPSRRQTDRLGSAGPGSDPPSARRRERLGDPGFLRRQQPRVLGAAQRFLRAFYAYDAGSRDPKLTATVRGLSTGRLARRLLDASAPRLPAAMEHPPAPAWVIAMSVEFDQPPTTALVRVRTARGARESVSGLVLKLVRGRWRASQLTE